MGPFSLISDTPLEVLHTCDCCGDFNLDFDGQVVRWESNSPELAGQYGFLCGKQITVPARSLIKALDTTKRDYVNFYAKLASSPVAQG